MLRLQECNYVASLYTNMTVIPGLAFLAGHLGLDLLKDWIAPKLALETSSL